MTTTPNVQATTPNAADTTGTPAATVAGAPAAAAPVGKTDAELKAISAALDAKAAEDATKTAGDKSQTKTDKPADKASESPEFAAQLPEGMVADEALLKGFTAKVKEFGLKPDQAQALLDVYVGRVQEQQAAWEAEKKGFTEAAKKDPEIGGAKLSENLATAKRVLEKYGSPGLQKLAFDTNLGDHPEFIRLLHRVAKATANDTIAGTTTAAQTQTNDERAALQARYPNSPSLFK